MSELPRSTPRKLILFSSDLMLISSVGGAAVSAGLPFCSVSTLEQATQQLSDENCQLCLDLNSKDAQPEAVAGLLPPNVLQRSIAFGPHVHVARLDQAREAGFGKVMSRGQFVTRMLDEFRTA